MEEYFGTQWHISMAQSKTAVTPLLMHWSYCSLALSHPYIFSVNSVHFDLDSGNGFLPVQSHSPFPLCNKSVYDLIVKISA